MNDVEKAVIKMRQLEEEEKKRKSRQQANIFDNVFEERKQPTKTWNYFDDVF